MNEFEIIQRYFTDVGDGSAVDVPIGDDAAVISMDGDTFESVSRCLNPLPDDPSEAADATSAAFESALRQLTGRGIKPAAFTLALTLPNQDGESLSVYVDGISRALHQVTCAHRLPLIGGDTTRAAVSPALTLFLFGSPGD